MSEPTREDAVKIADMFLKKHFDPAPVSSIDWDGYFRMEAEFQGGSTRAGENPDNIAVEEDRSGTYLMTIGNTYLGEHFENWTLEFTPRAWRTFLTTTRENKNKAMDAGNEYIEKDYFVSFISDRFIRMIS